MARPVDGMFRAGQISSKEWARLHPNEHGGGKGSQKSKMAKFESKDKDEATTKNKSVAGTKPAHINGPNQGMGTPARAGGKPSRGGDAHGNAGMAGHLDTHQKPNFPGQGPDRTRKSFSRQQPASSNPSDMGEFQYGGPPWRNKNAPRLKKVETGGSKF